MGETGGETGGYNAPLEIFDADDSPLWDIFALVLGWGCLISSVHGGSREGYRSKGGETAALSSGYRSAISTHVRSETKTRLSISHFDVPSVVPFDIFKSLRTRQVGSFHNPPLIRPARCKSQHFSATDQRSVPSDLSIRAV